MSAFFGACFVLCAAISLSSHNKHRYWLFYLAAKCQSTHKILFTTQKFVDMNGFSWDVFGHPLYSPGLLFVLAFAHIPWRIVYKQQGRTERTPWLTAQVATFYEECTQKLEPSYEMLEKSGAMLKAMQEL